MSHSAPENNKGVETVDEYRRLVDQLGKEICLCRVRVRRWRGRVSLTGAEVKAGDLSFTAGEDDVSTPSFFILPQSWGKQFDSVEGALRRALERKTVRAQITAKMTLADGSISTLADVLSDDAIVPRSSVESVRQEINSIIQDRWAPLVNGLVTDWDSIIQDLKEKKPHIYEKFAGRLPANADALRPAFKVVFLELPLGLSADSLTVEALRKGAGEYLDAIRDSIIGQNVDRVREVAKTMLARIQAGGGLRMDTLTSFAEAVSAFKSFAGAMSASDALPMLEQAEALLKETGVKEINADAKQGASGVAQQIAQVMDGVLKVMDQKVAQALQNKSQRRILLDEEGDGAAA